MFFQVHKSPLLIDEVQYAPELFSQIKLLVDAGANAGAFWLTGSQQFRLMELAGESLAGAWASCHFRRWRKESATAFPPSPSTCS